MAVPRPTPRHQQHPCDGVPAFHMTCTSYSLAALFLMPLHGLTQLTASTMATKQTGVLWAGCPGAHGGNHWQPDPAAWGCCWRAETQAGLALRTKGGPPP